MNYLLKTSLFIIAIALVSIFIGCNRTQPVTQETEPPVSPKPTVSPLTGFAADLQFVKNGQYTYIYIFSRKDGKPLQPDDSAFLRTNAPQMVDWVTTDEGKKVIGGTNFDLAEGNLPLLKRRFVVEDYSGK